MKASDGSLGKLSRSSKPISCFHLRSDDAKSHITSEDFDLIICGYYLDDGIGTDVLIVLRSNQKATPFILFTSVEELLPELQSENFYFIKKPELGILLNHSQDLLLKSKQLSN